MKPSPTPDDPRPPLAPTPTQPAPTAPPAHGLDLPASPWVLIVGNPFSGVGRNGHRTQRLADALAALGLPSLQVWDRQQRAALFADPRLAQHCRCIVSAGGDGTLGDVINQCPNLPVATLPLGTENLLARHFGHNAPADRLARAILAGRCRRIDLGRLWSSDAPGLDPYPGSRGVQARRFTLMATAGLDAQVAHHLARWRSAGGQMRRVRYASYFGPILNACRRYDYPPLELHHPHGPPLRGSSAMLFNLPCYGSHLGFGRGAVPDDGLLHWRVFSGAGVLATFAFTFDSFANRLAKRRDIATGLAASLHIDSQRPVPIQIDGDPAGFTPARFDILPQALNVITLDDAPGA